MDWNYILSVKPDDLNDDEKDELYNIVTWFDCESEDADLKKVKVLVKVSQEILKYKGEQVETLLHELEEMALKQGEDEARRQVSDTEMSSIKSRKSSTIEFENLEQKYIDLKSKHKKLQKTKEKYEIELNKINSTMRNLETENRRLQNELQSGPRDLGSESDVSETIRDQQRELVETLHNKNKQISDLLKDIEDVENENFILRDKLAKVRDELSVATKEITSMTDTLRANELHLKETTEKLEEVNEICDTLKKQFEDVKQAKDKLELHIKELTIEMHEKIDELQKQSNQKDEEIQLLKTRLREPSVNSSLSSLPKDDPEISHISALQRALADRENQLLEVKTQLQIATKEMDETTELLKRLKSDKARDNSIIKEMEDNVKDFKRQLKSSHERCQKLQDEVAFAEKNSACKEEELNEILNKMKENGQVDLAVNLAELGNLKSDNRMKEKHIISLVKASNKLQDISDRLEKENYFLREKLGIPEDEHLEMSGFKSGQKKMKKELETLKYRLVRKEEQQLQHKADIHKLNQVISSLTNQILDLGHKPVYDNVKLMPVVDANLQKDNKALAEENEALRKGMHEILNSINMKKSTSEIRSETFEKLLRALDVKHVSGWYHPAMRLQAELHNLEGINSELREQLREARAAKKYKTVTDDEPVKTENLVKQTNEDLKQEESSDLVVETSNLDEPISFDNIDSTLENLFANLRKDTTEEVKKAQQQFSALYKNLLAEKQQLEQNVKAAEDKLKEQEENHEIVANQLKILVDNETDEDKTRKIQEVVSSNVLLKRKIVHLENETKMLEKRIEDLYQDSTSAEMTYQKSIGELQRKNVTFENNLRMLKNLNDISVDFGTFKEVEKNLNNMVIKYRELASNVKQREEETSLEMKTLLETKKVLESDNVELKTKLVEVLSKQKIQNVQNFDDKVEKLAQKLAECEVNEITERQRANHTSNLYELVKEQLNKSEERFQEYSKYNEDLLKKNIIFQEQLKEAEDQVRDCVDNNLYTQQVTANNSLLKENERLAVLVSKLEEDLKLEKQSAVNGKTWNLSKEQELMNLKHQIVDLIAVSDEKIIIAQLNSDILQCKQSQTYYKTKFEETEQELNRMKDILEETNSRCEEEKTSAAKREATLNKKTGILRNLMAKQKLQYLGSVPLCSEEIYLSKLRLINKEKHQTFLSLHKTKRLENETLLLKDQLLIEIDYVKAQKDALTDGFKEEYMKVSNWMQEKKTLQINELRYRRQSEFKEAQLENIMERVKMQNDHISKLEEELLLWHKYFDPNDTQKDSIVEETRKASEAQSLPVVKITTKCAEAQTIEETKLASDKVSQISSLKSELMTTREKLIANEQTIHQLRGKITEHEMTISMFRKQIGDKQSQITFYERHILELQNKKEDVHANGAGGDNISVGMDASINNEELISLKSSVKSLEDNLKLKEEEIVKYQTLLKIDRDKHSLAAATLQEELQKLQRLLTEEKQKFSSLEETFLKSRPNRAAVEQYMTQVHALETHTSELHTKVTSLEAQLQSSRQEAVRWRSLANDRLTAMEELRKSLDEQHKNELSVYKIDAEKLKELGKDEANSLRQFISRQKSESTGRLDADIQSLVREKDDKIHELTIKLRQMKEAAAKKSKEPEQQDFNLKVAELESSMEQLGKENDLLRKRYEHVLGKEKSAKNEIRELKAQLLRKPTSARSDKSEKSVKEQLHKKIATLENEIVDLKSSLAEQISINDTHRVQASDDFDKWKKMKHWQQCSEKLKNKLKERDGEFEKLQQTSAGYRLLIERLEREKHNLEQRIKNLKSTSMINVASREVEMLKLDNMKLSADVEALTSRLEMQQHHSGGLGAAMMQEKLESQERKIAILELAAKGTTEVRTEIERLQLAVSNFQKTNLRLEAENLDIKLDLEKCTKEVPHLEQQIQHLENYIDVLKSENSKQCECEKPNQSSGLEPKKVSDLERTVFMLRRVVEKLQADNKRLISGKRPLSDRSASAEKLKRDHVRLKEQYGECLQKLERLEQELAVSQSKVKNMSLYKKPDSDRGMAEELSKVKEQLEQKSSLLDKVKVLLHRAAAKEKSLLQEIIELKRQKEGVICPIPEESEGSSSDC